MSRVVDIKIYRLRRRFLKIVYLVEKYPDLFPLLDQWITLREQRNTPAARAAAARHGDGNGSRSEL